MTWWSILLSWVVVWWLGSGRGYAQGWKAHEEFIAYRDGAFDVHSTSWNEEREKSEKPHED